MADTPNLGISLIEASQAQKHVTMNEALYVIDALLQATVISQLATPPGSPTNGDTHIIIATATGDWTGHEDKIAAYINSAWEFITPKEGWRVYDQNLDRYVIYDGSDWDQFDPKAPSFTVSGAPSASSSGAGAIIYVSDETGGAVLAFSDGTDWRRTTDRAVIA
jgi:hypothetical protein